VEYGAVIGVVARVAVGVAGMAAMAEDRAVARLVEARRVGGHLVEVRQGVAHRGVARLEAVGAVNITAILNVYCARLAPCRALRAAKLPELADSEVIGECNRCERASPIALPF